MTGAAPAAASRRRAILDSALAVFTEQGLAAASIQDIRARSGASIGSIYHHFGSKEGIAAALYAEAIADYQRGALEVLRAALDAGAGIRGLVRHFLLWVRDHRQLAGLMLSVERHELRALAAPQVKELNRAFRQPLRELISAHEATNALPELPEDVLLPALLGPARAYAGQWVAGRARTPLEEAADRLADLAWSGLAGPATDRR